MDDLKLFPKVKKNGKISYMHLKYSQDKRMEYGIEKCAMLVMKSGEQHLTDGMELPNQDKIRTRGEKEIYKYLGMFEPDYIKQVEMKKIKNISRELERFLRQNYLAETLS